MMESVETTNSPKWWKRPLIGGLLSMLSVIITFGLFEGIIRLPNPRILMWLTMILFFVQVGYISPAEIIGIQPKSEFLFVFTILIFWFLAGALIAYLDKNTKRAIVWWIFLFIVITFIQLFYVGLPM